MIVEISTGPMSHIVEHLAHRHTVAAQSIGDDALRFVFHAGQQALEDAFGRGGVPPPLHQDIEHDHVLIYRTPEVMQHTVDRQEDLLEVSGVAWLRLASAGFGWLRLASAGAGTAFGRSLP